MAVLDDFSKAGGIQAAGRGITLFLMHPELEPAPLTQPLFPCLPFSYFPVIISVTISQVARLQCESLSDGNAQLKLLLNEKAGQE